MIDNVTKAFIGIGFFVLLVGVLALDALISGGKHIFGRRRK